LSVEEYLKLDNEAERPSEYADGFMVEIESATPNHARITGNLAFQIRLAFSQSKYKCEIFGSDLRVYLPSTDRYVHPDITVAWGEESFVDNTLLNPVLIGEVLSPATEDYDKGRKFDGYRSIPSLKEYLTVAQERVHIDRCTVSNGIWSLVHSYTELIDVLELSFDLTIPMEEIYRNVTFPAD
jgi:Uma2 family endonuclease